MSDMQAGGTARTSDARQVALAQLEQWKSEAYDKEVIQARRIGDGDEGTWREQYERGQRYEFIRAAEHPLQAADGTIEEAGWELDAEGGRGGLSVNEPGLPTRAMDAWCGWAGVLRRWASRSRSGSTRRETSRPAP